MEVYYLTQLQMMAQKALGGQLHCRDIEGSEKQVGGMDPDRWRYLAGEGDVNVYNTWMGWLERTNRLKLESRTELL